ncbi:hypothetical protein F511_07491 [Dorcoceras hygrometricum]|uniref:Uncharacterized protein n=1 Tax=Dorcoceras hygrometricum TaxID=472368 RepID=A0A2Z7D6R3_9LAMI|nr:hypothetical protein F511_07491 [Dorcoceras hygrometricum]
MGKAEMMRTMREKKSKAEGSSGEAVPFSLARGKRKVLPAGDEHPRKRSGKSPAREVPMVGEEPHASTKELPEERPALSPQSLSAIVPDKDLDFVMKTPDAEVIEAASLHFLQALVWSGEVLNRLCRAHYEVVLNRRSMDGVLSRHDQLMKQFEDLCKQKDEEKQQHLLELEAPRALVQSSAVEIQRLKKEVNMLKEEVKTAGKLEKEKFLKSPEFESLCVDKACAYFEQGFNGCLAQF